MLNIPCLTVISVLCRKHRQLLRGHFCEGHRQTRVLRGLALLVESGAIYCVLLVCTSSPLSIFQSLQLYPPNASLQGVVLVDQCIKLPSGSTFQTIEVDYSYDCFVPIVVSTRTTHVCSLHPALTLTHNATCRRSTRS